MGVFEAEKTLPPPELGFGREQALLEASDERTCRRRYEALVQRAVDRALDADRAGSVATKIAAREALHVALAHRGRPFSEVQHVD
jgi:hypothetical protein